jgi:predicted transcriptional regulator
MSHPVGTINAHETLDYRHLLVVDDDAPVGILSQTDIALNLELLTSTAINDNCPLPSR